MMRLNGSKWRVDIAPELGGGLLAGRYDGVDVMFPARLPVSGFAPLCLSSFPLVPFSNRIRDGRFAFNGKDIELEKPMPGEANAIHGHGWVRPWSVLSFADKSATLELVHDASDWPWDYVARQDFSIKKDVFTHTLSVTNRSRSPMPAGLGLHPYFPRTSDCEVEYAVRGVWTGPVHGIPARREELPSYMDFSTRKVPGPEFIDHCFEGWTGQAELRWPDRGVGIRMGADDAARHLVTYFPCGEDFFCIEPVTHMNDAVNWPGDQSETGLRVLAPGESLSVTMTLTGFELS